MLRVEGQGGNELSDWNGRMWLDQWGFVTIPGWTHCQQTKYYSRNLVWQTMARLVRGGLTAEIAIGRLHSVYGYDSSTSKIMTTMVRDKRRYPGGMHPNLR